MNLPAAGNAAGNAEALAVLRRFARPRPPAERCELCSAALPAEHRHLWEISARRMICSCDPCSLLFEGAGERKFRMIPHRIEDLTGFRLSDGQWSLLALPIDLAFFFRSSESAGSSGGIRALYPSPAGATESLLSLEAWQSIAAENPVLDSFQEEIEALLVNRARGARDYYRVSIDECYRLTGLIRLHWSGLSGGTRAWQEIAQFFARLKQSASQAASPGRGCV